MSVLTFTNEELAALHAEGLKYWPKGTRSTWGQTEPAPRGYWLVGDEGVYLMHNGANQPAPAHVIYAIECNPKVMDFDSWWEAKQRTFGGDDGCEFLEPELIEQVISNGSDLAIRFTANQLELVEVRQFKPKQARN